MCLDVCDVLFQAGLFIISTIIVCSIFAGSKTSGWNYLLKYIAARFTVSLWKRTLRPDPLCDGPRPWQSKGFDAFTIKASTPDGEAIVLSVKKLFGPKNFAQVHIFVKLLDGTYKLPFDSGTLISEWEDVSSGWSSGGLQVEVLEPQDRFRIIFNGLLLRQEDGNVQHVKFNFIWVSATQVIEYPKDWSNSLAAEALASEPWANRSWLESLNECTDGAGSCSQFGALQGRFQVFDDNGKIAKSEYLRYRGVKERSWLSDYGPQRSVVITAAARDGTVLNIQGLSFSKNITQCISGSVRFPNFTVHTITSADLDLTEFCETANAIPRTFSINIKAGNRCLKVILRISDEGFDLLSGLYQQHEVHYRMLFVEMYGEHGSGILELQYERKDRLSLPIYVKPGRRLKWVDVKDVPESLDYCLGFEEIGASCVQMVGGKGASLALLASQQNEKDYQVPPGFCITTRALDRFLELNPEVRTAIKEIEAAGVDYAEAAFKEKCAKATQLILSNELNGELKDSIINSLEDLRKKSLSTEPRFAVRSSGVGEDGEALSAAGQNDTVLGVRSSQDVCKAVLACWASMFAFTSANYRRQNGQPCLVQGGVVVQELVEARVAGVMFTTHPHGDPSRLLLTANYGLGESVVSGMVEPDTIVVKRNTDDALSIAQVEVGSKAQRIVAGERGVEAEDVSEGDRSSACLNEEEIMRLARLGVMQEQLWGSGRDIEFAIGKEGTIYLLQARPITSLETWSAEELLHELDFPVMADDELLTFANVGEVLPKPFTALSYDLVLCPLDRGISLLIPDNKDPYTKSVVATHYRAAVALYNSVYRRVPKTIDVNLRMLEMAIHGHRVADDAILATAIHRRPPERTDRLWAILDMIKNLLIAKRRMNETIDAVSKLDIGSKCEDISDLCRIITQIDNTKLITNHAITSVASTFTQFIAMSVLLEGKSDFTPEQCAEVSAMLNSGDVLSAEVPQNLATLALMLEESGRGDEFKKQDPKTAMSWLQINLPSVFERVTKFLEQHGHRAIMEFDLSTKPWALVPEELMKVLMQVVPDHQERAKLTRDQVIDAFKTPQKPNTRKVLHWILPLCHRTVRYRESTKAHFILAIHKLRLAVLKLGDFMVRDWYLPSADLVFHFRSNELSNYVKTRDPALLKKAIQRRNYYERWAKLKFAEVNKGWVEPLSVAPLQTSAGGARVVGTVVCGGEIIARACVVRDLAEIGELRSGDVLITASTDIGWSPYFPLLAGIVTELGGLISHGAVIAREYGLPCMVGAEGATSLFRTGDLVRLTGDGIVETVTGQSDQNA